MCEMKTEKSMLHILREIGRAPRWLVGRWTRVFGARGIGGGSET
jgi:hypothetical protein